MAGHTERPGGNPESYVGLTTDRAEELARQRGCTRVRIVPPHTVVTAEYVVGRVNFAVDDGRVVRCWIG